MTCLPFMIAICSHDLLEVIEWLQAIDLSEDDSTARD